jgi:hypothetical protein
MFNLFLPGHQGMRPKGRNKNSISMETKSNTSVISSTLLFVFMVFQSFWLQAQEPGVSKKIVSGDQMNSLYIIGSVLVFGVVAYFVYSMIDKHRQAKEGDKPQTRRPVSHRNHHHHRVIKKSA